MNYPTWTAGVHHDGSALYVSNPLPSLNETVNIRLRVPVDAPITGAFIRTEPDGEQHFSQMTEHKRDSVCVWYTGDIPMRNKLMRYRFKLLTSQGAYYYNALGISRADMPDTNDFKLLADFDAPDWVNSAVFYQIFPDRFHNSDPTLTPPEGLEFYHPPQGTFTSRQMNWDDDPLPFMEGGTVDFFGGDLPGIQQKLHYLQDLGVNALYLNPIFASPTNHRYNITDFYKVDPYLGGDDALFNLSEALHQRGMYYVLDITPNHTGHTIDWFTEAQQDENAPSADYYTFYERPHSYENWLGISTLPKLNYRSESLRKMMFRDENAIMRYWLREPFNADGWRLDVWNMVARQGDSDQWHEIGRELRESVKSVREDAYVFGENFFDSSSSLQGDELDATMNYQGFSFPVWRWLVGYDLGAWSDKQTPYTDSVPMPAEATAEQMQAYMAVVPWVVTRMQFNQLGSHDTPRILHIVGGNKALAKVAVTLLMTFPGVPCVYYGDEIGMSGGADPDNRRTMPWDESQWDSDLRGYYQRLITLRRERDALVNGGFQVIHAEGDLFAYLRESETDRLIMVANRSETPHDIKLPVAHAGIPDGITFTGVVGDGSGTVTDGHLPITVPAQTAYCLVTG